MRTRSVVVLSAATLAVAVSLTWAVAGTPEPRGTQPPGPPSTPPRSDDPAAASPVEVRPAVPRTVREPVPPVRVTVAGAGIDVPVRPVGVAADGQVEVPADARFVGWYRFGPPPGSATGSVVLVGHRDSTTQGAGALFPLDRARPGSLVTVSLADGTALTYRVTELRRYDKQGLPLGTLFDRAGTPRLTLVTCGGPYDPQRGGYLENLVATAVPAGAP